MKEITYQKFTAQEWSEYPKDGFKTLINRWCERHGFMQYVELGKKICDKLPYRICVGDRNSVEVASDFIDMAEVFRAREIFKA